MSWETWIQAAALVLCETIAADIVGPFQLGYMADFFFGILSTRLSLQAKDHPETVKTDVC